MRLTDSYSMFLIRQCHKSIRAFDLTKGNKCHTCTIPYARLIVYGQAFFQGMVIPQLLDLMAVLTCVSSAPVVSLASTRTLYLRRSSLLAQDAIQLRLAWIQEGNVRVSEQREHE